MDTIRGDYMWWIANAFVIPAQQPPWDLRQHRGRALCPEALALRTLGRLELCWELRLPGVFWGLTRALQLRLFSLLHFKAAVCDLAQSHPWSLRGKWLMWVKKIHLGTYGKNPDRQNVKSFSWTLSNRKGSYSLRLQWPDRWRTWADWRYEGGVGMGTKYTVWLSQAWLPACSKISVREKERRWWKGKVPLLRMPVGNRIFLAYQ